MGYEFVIRSRAADRPIADAVLVARLAEAAAKGLAPDPSPSPTRTATAVPPPTGPWTLRNGKGRVEVRLYRVEDAIRGADFDVPFPGSEEELRRAYDFLQQVAESLEALVFDPQLACEVGKGTVDDVVARWRQSQSWMVDVAGNVEDPRSLGDLVQPEPILNRRNKVILTVVGGFIVFYWLVETIADFWRH